MSASLTAADVQRIAALAHLELTPAQTEQFTRQLTDVLAYVEQLQQVDTSGVEATAHVLTSQSTEREDVPRPSLSPADAVANAPDGVPEAGLFRVPRVIGG
jgi:aspartyl-tRNA(Asn)/glutamyl-tRNA(Gln) amidotransferase subunit C